MASTRTELTEFTAIGAIRRSTAPGAGMMNETEIDAAIARLEVEMQDLPHRHRDLFSYANAWAVRHDAIVAATPREMRSSVERRLHRVGVRWGVANGARMTMQFPALKIPA